MSQKLLWLTNRTSHRHRMAILLEAIHRIISLIIISSQDWMAGDHVKLHGSMSSPTMHRHLNSVDWRTQLCQLFDAPHETHDEELFKMLEISRSKLALPDNPDTESGRFSMPYHTIHRVTCLARQSTEMYLDTPWVVQDVSGAAHVHGSIVVRNVALHMKQYTNLAFIVYKSYTCCSGIPLGAVAQLPPTGAPVGKFQTTESVCLISEELSAGLKRLTRQNIHENPYYPSFNIGTEFEAPYPWFYNQRAHLEERRRQLKPELLSRVNSFVEYVNDSFGEEYAIVDSLLNKGMISPKYLNYLYSPDTVVLRANTKEGLRKKAYLTKSWLFPRLQDQSIANGDPIPISVLSLSVSSWTFDGAFHEDIETIAIECLKNPDEIIKIPSLPVYPMRFADSAIGIALRKQGEMFWKLRRGGYVYYSDEDGVNESVGQSRYMIDVETYNKLHPELRETKTPNQDDLGPAAMASDTPPDGVFTLLLPNKIVGFSMQEKKWTHLEVSRIYPIKWDKEAFERLAVDDNTKVLVTALVANQITEEQNPGVGGGKTNGSIVLLHGGSGTGKTLTAERSYARKYSESTGADIKPRKTLELWCFDIQLVPNKYIVILLEEAELFLEKRTLGDLQRNALVSGIEFFPNHAIKVSNNLPVFLRAIESYTGMFHQLSSPPFPSLTDTPTGILILTSTPLTTLDPTLKSRIQLSLRYSPLTVSQRLKIWSNHIAQLESLESLFNPSTINISELRANLPALAKCNLNGHEIAHAIRSARQVALWKGVEMGFAEVEFVVGTVEGGEDGRKEVGKGEKPAEEDDTEADIYGGLEGVEDLMNV
ncbi:hypothetical protein CJF30_00005059 [Rutstroemia sp. NJR-2017a BBW]|nr:hypothetical protein CJF30_00005059 [Rutstroemia sp. NJR-2017a BBW]